MVHESRSFCLQQYPHTTLRFRTIRSREIRSFGKLGEAVQRAPSGSGRDRTWIGCTGKSSNYVNILRRIMDELQDYLSEAMDDILTDLKEMEKTFPSWLE